jgi:hypothetical protein
MAINETTTSRRGVAAMLAAAAAAIPAIMSKTAMAGETDPIFALIEQHKAAMAEHMRLLDIKSVISFRDEAYADAEEESDQAYDLVNDAQIDLLTTSPTTVAGAAAVLAYVASFWIEGDDSAKRGLPIYDPPMGRTDMDDAGDGFLPMIAAALQRLTLA